MIQYQNEHVTVFQSALYQTTSTVIQTKEMILIVDPNWLPNEIEAIQQHVNTINGEREIYLLFTHGDFDHIIGYQAFPNAKTIGSLELHNHPKKEHKLKLIRDFDNQNYIVRNYPIQFPELDIVIQEDGQQLHLGDATLTFYHAPGHTADGLMTVFEPLGILIAGDYLSNFELPFIYQSAKAYTQTLEKCAMMLEKHPVRLLIPGHGAVTTEPEEMKRRLDLASDYLKRLRKSVIANDEAALEALYQEHAFLSSFTEECHKENVSIMKREY
ncbi:MBL fold metallo-hydrolase [Paenibacillus planticolens]|uniref:MBL fold metallo-hydrolase n=1 Tax=Paenibacillus planticolens TaxID=2654976 RepID=A0ABX1ZT31_9BACL|nr:MBL fold metallo-hydrolase [Paenibacillus planticolens]NOV02092.1 MBL fold metallo-hydrolase [Paenibacillus planticolens]